jgi:hypothetical protein
MDRRTLLAAAGGTLGTVAGCLGAPGTDDDSPADGPATGTGTGTRTGIGTGTATHADDGAPTGGGDRTPVSALPCPPHPAGPDVVCAWTADPDAASVVLVPSSTTTADPSSLRLRLHNRSSSSLTFHPYSWRLHRRVDGNWTRVESTVAGDGDGGDGDDGDDGDWVTCVAAFRVTDQV